MGVLARAMILAAGFGTRLGGLTELKPKPMLPVCGAPLVRWAALWLRHYGVREIVINLHHLGEQIEAELGNGHDLGVDIAYSREEGMILGTGGGLRHARHLFDDGTDTPVVLINGKILIDLDLPRLLARHAQTQAEATMVLREDPNAERWGSLQTADDGRIVRLLGATPEHGADIAPTSSPLMFTGVHVIQPRFIDRVPPSGEQCVIKTAYRELFHEAKSLHGYETREYWWEHSTPERYLEGVFNVLRGKAQLVYAPAAVRGVAAEAKIHPNATIRDPVWIGKDAEVGAGATVGPHVQLGKGAIVEPDAQIEQTIVWDGARVSGTVHDDVVTG